MRRTDSNSVLDRPGKSSRSSFRGKVAKPKLRTAMRTAGTTAKVGRAAQACLAALIDRARPDANGDWFCFPSVAKIGRDIGVQARQARRLVRELETAGLIVVVPGGGRSVNCYLIPTPPEALDEPGTAGTNDRAAESEATGHPGQECPGTPVRNDRPIGSENRIREQDKNNTTTANDDDGTTEAERDVGAERGGGAEILIQAGVWRETAEQYADTDPLLARFLVRYAARNDLGAGWIVDRLRNPSKTPPEYVLIRELVALKNAELERETAELEQRRQRVAQAWPDIVSLDAAERARAHLCCCGTNARWRGAAVKPDFTAAARWSKVNLLHDDGEAADKIRGMIREKLPDMRRVWSGEFPSKGTTTNGEQDAARCGIRLDDLATEPPKPVSCNVDRLLDLDEATLRADLRWIKARSERITT